MTSEAALHLRSRYAGLAKAFRKDIAIEVAWPQGSGSVKPGDALLNQADKSKGKRIVLRMVFTELGSWAVSCKAELKSGARCCRCQEQRSQ